jgi:DNA-binding MarR family transcriptional regulator
MGSHASREDATKVLDALRRIVRFLRLSARASETKAGLTPAQLFVLAQLDGAPAASIRALAERTLTDPSSVSVVVARLEEQGLIARAEGESDRRRSELSLTARGRATLAKAPELPQVRIVEAVAAMTPARRRAVTRALADLVSAIGAEELEPKMFFEDEPHAKKGASRERKKESRRERR